MHLWQKPLRTMSRRSPCRPASPLSNTTTIARRPSTRFAVRHDAVRHDLRRTTTGQGRAVSKFTDRRGGPRSRLAMTRPLGALDLMPCKRRMLAAKRRGHAV